MKKIFLVIGLGTFGRSVAKSLYDMGNDVLAIDKDEDRVEEIIDDVTQAIQFDATDEHALKSLGLNEIDTAFVAIGSDIKASILVTVLCKDLGVKFVVAKAQDDLHAKILKKIGADRVVFPEREMGVRLAFNLTSSNLLDCIELSDEYTLIEVSVFAEWIGKSLSQLNLRKHYGINVMAIKHTDGTLNVSPLAEDIIKDDDVLIVIGKNDDLMSLEAASHKRSEKHKKSFKK